MQHTPNPVEIKAPTLLRLVRLTFETRQPSSKVRLKAQRDAPPALFPVTCLDFSLSFVKTGPEGHNGLMVHEPQP